MLTPHPTDRIPRGDSELRPFDLSAPMPSTIGRYEIRELLGTGGMASVYRAFDPTLNRPVALKFLRETDRDHLTRFLREARAQAQIGHDNICDVYETGIVEGRPFIAMRCIDGVTLAEAALRMSVDEKVAVMVEVAEALHAAHRTGLVHRDLKPNNIMVEPKPDGGWYPWVLDFGLARDSSMDSMTTIGTVVGTPPYMAPEQARADRSKIDRRTDVYSLGATLFDILIGRPPFLAESAVDVMMKVVTEDAPSMRSLDPTISADLDTIVMKCLEKDPQRRYESARALADDLRRYLDGEPIAARRTTFVHRWIRRARKHPTIATLLAVAGVAVLASIAWAVTASVQSAKRQQAAQRFGQEIERMEAIARYSSMLPLHDVQRERRWIRDRIARIELDLPSMSRTSAGPARYAIGRGYLALHDWGSSRRHLDAAWNGDYRTAEVAYALGRVIGAQYQEALSDAERIANADARAARKRQIEKEYRDEALAWLRRSGVASTPSATSSRKNAGAEGPLLSSESAAYVEGLIAFYEKRYDVALERARKAFADVPWLHEAKKLEGDIWIARGFEQANAGDTDAAAASYTRAGDAFREAEGIAASDESVLLGDAERWFRLMLLAIAQGDDPAPQMTNGLAAADRASKTNGDLEASYRAQAVILQRYGDWQLSQGQSPLDSLDRAVAFSRRAVAADPKSSGAHRILGNALFTRARYAMTHGEDAVPIYDAAIRSLEQSVALEPNNAQALMSLANAIRRKAEVAGTQGANPVALLNQSIVYYDRAAAADPEFANIFNDRGLAFMTRGEWEMENGIDPTASFNETAKSLERAIAINPKFSVAMLNLGSTHLDRGNYAMRRGIDSRPVFAQAIAAFDAALKINPKLAFAHANTGLSYMLMAQDALDRNEDPEPLVKNGLAAYERALAINPEHANSFAYSGALHLVRGQAIARNGGDPSQALAAARESIRRADAIDRDSADFMQFVAAVEAEAARDAIAKRKSPAAFLAAGEAAIARGVSQNAADADLLFYAADLARLRGDVSRAIELVDRSIAVDREKSESHALRGELFLHRAIETGDRRFATHALTELDHAMALKPSTRWKWLTARQQAMLLAGDAEGRRSARTESEPHSAGSRR
jgi:hypothetical protein